MILAPFVLILGLLSLSLVFQSKLKIPLPFTLMGAVLVFAAQGSSLISLNSKEFDSLILLSLPILLASDALKLDGAYLVKNSISVFMVAVLGVLSSVLFSVLLAIYVIPLSGFPVLSLVVLFVAVSATDPITITSIFSNFKVSHRLKFIAESESLFNDGTTLIILNLCILLFNNPEVTPLALTGKGLSILGGAALVGVLSGFSVVFLMKLTKDVVTEIIIILFGVYASFYISELFHFSGILAVIITSLISNFYMIKIVQGEDLNPISRWVTAHWTWFGHLPTTSENYSLMLKVVDFIALSSAGIVFIATADFLSFDKMYEYWFEILIVFAISTVARVLTMLKFSAVSNKVSFLESINVRWLGVLSLAGSKGAISILMIHMLPSNFPKKEALEHIVIGNVILSTFIYGILLLLWISYHKEYFDAEASAETH